ncbi:MAG: hypothetical protein ACE5FV_00165 [Woeseia sp.]
MNEFEYLAVFVSIIFGISLTHVLRGAIRSVYRRTVNDIHLVWTGFILMVMILNWWTLFPWSEQTIWSFYKFLVIILWSVAHYLAAITLYPPQAAGTESPFEYRRNWFLWAFAGLVLMDILQTAARGGLFVPWYYLPFVLHFALLALLGVFLQKPVFHRWLAWYFLIVIVVWSLIVRRFLV